MSFPHQFKTFVSKEKTNKCVIVSALLLQIEHFGSCTSFMLKSLLLR